MRRTAILEAERSLRERQATERDTAIADRMRSLRTELQRVEVESALAQHRLDLARRSADRFEQLAREGFVSDAQRQMKLEELLDVQVRAEAAERTRISMQRELLSLAADRTAARTQLETEVAQLNRTLATS
jgi:membrane fusion protein